MAALESATETQLYATSLPEWLKAQASFLPDPVEDKQEWSTGAANKLTKAGFQMPKDIITAEDADELGEVGFTMGEAETLIHQAEAGFHEHWCLQPKTEIQVEFSYGPLCIRFKGVPSKDQSDHVLIAGFVKGGDGEPGPAENSGKLQRLDCLTGINGRSLDGLNFDDICVQVSEAAFPYTLTFTRAEGTASATKAPAVAADQAQSSTEESSGATMESQMEGWLRKQGHFNTSWRRRYFVLRLGQLEYYTDEPQMGGQLRGVIPLKGSTVYSLADAENPNTFAVQTVVNGETKSFPIKAENEASRECWIELARFHGTDAVMTGWLTKCGHIVPNWKKRWFVLENTGKMHYFTGPSGQLKGTINVVGATVVPGKKDEYFNIETAGKDKNYIIRAETRNESSAWAHNIREISSSVSKMSDSTYDSDSEVTAPKSSGGSFMSSWMGRKRSSKTMAAASSPARTRSESSSDLESEQDIALKDFELMKVVGRGAFGKVMMCKKLTGEDKGRIYAVKVLIKSVIAAKKQVENTKAERQILLEIRHPFIVRLRYAFQSQEKLYFVTDYYNGGSMFYHVRKSRGFDVQRTRFYAAELMLAIEHLHQHGIIYRDLKLENILMDHLGHIALTDFGLSKQNVKSVMTEQLKTFCGTAEYIAPELLKGLHYGAAVDWWSYGILVYEMKHVKTPFYDRNRKLMFHAIINMEPNMPNSFPQEMQHFVLSFLKKKPKHRMGCGANGEEDIKGHPFFAAINWDDLFDRKVVPPFTPNVKSETDTKYVNSEYLKMEAKDSIVKPSSGTRHQKGTGQWAEFTYSSGSLDAE